MNYKSKYLKYKNKYLLLKNKIGGKKEFKYEDYDIKKMREKIDQLNNDIKEINHLNIEIKNLKDDISDILKQIELEEKIGIVSTIGMTNVNTLPFKINIK